MWDADWPVAVALSPKVHAYVWIVPSGSVEAEPFTATDRPFGVAVKDAVGGALFPLVTVTELLFGLHRVLPKGSLIRTW